MVFITWEIKEILVLLNKLLCSELDVLIEEIDFHELTAVIPLEEKQNWRIYQK